MRRSTTDRLRARRPASRDEAEQSSGIEGSAAVHSAGTPSAYIPRRFHAKVPDYVRHHCSCRSFAVAIRADTCIELPGDTYVDAPLVILASQTDVIEYHRSIGVSIHIKIGISFRRSGGGLRRTESQKERKDRGRHRRRTTRSTMRGPDVNRLSENPSKLAAW